MDKINVKEAKIKPKKVHGEYILAYRGTGGKISSLRGLRAGERGTNMVFGPIYRLLSSRGNLVASHKYFLVIFEPLVVLFRFSSRTSSFLAAPPSSRASATVYSRR
jgi:hypothetical protein